MLFGIALYTLACLLCASSGNVEMLIVSRILQGAGAAAASSIVFAICKDVFTGAQRQRVFVQIGVIVAAAPVIAPVIGAWIMEILTWQWVFLLQAGMASVAFVGVLKMDESLQQKKEEGVWRAFGSYGRLLLNIKYMLLVVTLSIFGMPVFAFIAGSSDLYITRLGYNERQFGYFFALNALAFVFAPLTFSRLARRYAPSHLIPFAFVGMICSALLFLWTAIPMPWRLTVPMFMVTFCFSFCRPGGSNLILEQVDRDAGAASSLMVFAYFLTGSMAMWLFSLEWNDKLQALSIMTCAPVLLALILWGIWYWLDAGKTGGVTVAE